MSPAELVAHIEAKLVGGGSPLLDREVLTQAAALIRSQGAEVERVRTNWQHEMRMRAACLMEVDRLRGVVDAAKRLVSVEPPCHCGELAPGPCCPACEADHELRAALRALDDAGGGGGGE